MIRVLFVLSFALLAACTATNSANRTESLSQVATRAEPQPAAASLSDGLAVDYYYASFDQIRDLTSWMEYKDGEAGTPLDKLSYDSGRGDVLTSSSENLVGAHITGFLVLDTPGTYRFQVTNNDGVRVHLGGARIHDDPRTGRARTSPPIPVEISEPGLYPIEIWYFEKNGSAVLDVQWSPPGSDSMAPVPLSAMKH